MDQVDDMEYLIELYAFLATRIRIDTSIYWTQTRHLKTRPTRLNGYHQRSRQYLATPVTHLF